MLKISNIEIEPLTEYNHLKLLRMFFEENGKKRNWDLQGAVLDIIDIIIFNVTRDVLIFVKQFRPAVYYGQIPSEDRKSKIDSEKYPTELGVTIELCGGRIHKKLPLIHVATEEILSKTGYKVSADQIEFVSSYVSGVGDSSSLQTLFYCEVSDDMREAEIRVIDKSYMELVEFSVPEIKKYMNESNVIASPPNLMFAMYWFLANKVKAGL